jgi:exopolysaccharide biosynthesis polyprenyl glycosylphosphotransferase
MFLVLPVSFLAALYLRFYSGVIPIIAEPAHDRYLAYILLAAIVWWGLLERYCLASAELLLLTEAWMARVLWACFLLLFLLTTVMFFYRDYSFSRTFTVLFVGIHFTAVLAVRGWLLHSFRRLRQAMLPSKTLLVGSPDLLKRVRERLESAPIPTQVVGQFGQNAGQGVQVETPVAWSQEAISGLLDATAPDEVVVAIPHHELRSNQELFATLRALSVPTRVVLDFEDLVDPCQAYRNCGLTMVDLEKYPRESIGYLVGKRIFDVGFSSLVLILGAPILLGIALAIWATMGRPILFRQLRVGLDGKEFWMYKFRTMQNSNPQDADTVWTTVNDPRPTKVGRWLRRLSLDELPQFWNVLRGEMSVVGPRPERPHFVREFRQKFNGYARRHYLKVGITGWAQVNGLRGDCSIEQRLRYDLLYLKNWSFMLDLKILWLTVMRGFSDPNAY